MTLCLSLLGLIGCSDSADLTAMKAALRISDEVVESTKVVQEKQEKTIVVLKENTAALGLLKESVEKLTEASLVRSNPNGKESGPESAQNPPAKANTQQTPLKVATPGDFSKVAADGTRLKWNVEGDWNPDILTTARHLREEHGIDTNGMTHQQMADLHASIHDGKPVAAKSETVRYVSRGTNCPNGQCPTTSTRYVRRSRR